MNGDKSVDLAISNHQGNWWFKINWWGSCTAVTGNSVNGIQGYNLGTHSVWAYSDSSCSAQIASTTFTISAASLAATVNSDRSVDLVLSNGPSPWYFRIGNSNGWGSCTAVSGTTVSGISGYQKGSYDVGAFSKSDCTDFLADAYFIIPDPPQPTATLATTVNPGPSVNLTLSNGPSNSNWWFRINWWGSCTAVTGTNTVNNIQGYQAGTHSVDAYSDSGCHTKIASSSFTIPSLALAATVDISDWSVDLTLTGGPTNWWFKIGWWGGCTAATGTTVANIRGYQSGWYDVGVYPAAGCAAGDHIAMTSFKIPTATLAATVNDDRSVNLTLNDGPSSWWFRINYWGTCTAASGNTVSNIAGYQNGTHSVAAYSDGGCNYHVAATTFSLYSLTASAVTQTSATLTIAGHTGNWYTKETSPATNASCSSAISGGTHSLSSLTGGTTYTYKAYSDSACSNEIASETFTITAIDYDVDADGLIEITTLAQLNAVRYDLDGNGLVTGSNRTNYRNAFTGASYTGATAMGCPSTGCTGYELSNDLDFDTNGNDSADSGDTYWNNGAGWTPIGGWSDYFTGTFEGNSNKLSNLHINATSSSDDSTPDIGGLFGSIGKGGAVKNLGLEDVNITVSSTGDNAEDGIQVGAVAADNRGTITGVWSSGSVTGSSQRKSSDSWVNVGGLVARNDKGGSGSDAYEGVIRASYSTAAVTSRAASTTLVNADARAAGLVAVNKGTIAASFATGNVNTNRSTATASLRRARTGGLVAINNGGTVTASYATGNITSTSIVSAWDGGLVGRNNNGTVTASYSTGTVMASSGATKNRGGLVARNDKGGSGSDAYEGVIRASYSTAAVTSRAASTTLVNADARAAGLVAVNKGTIAASFATGNVNTNRSTATASLRRARTGGLVAINNGGTVTASYATGNITSTSIVSAWDGGLVGRNNNGTVTASYSTGTVMASSGATKNRGGLVGTNEGSGTVTDSYWDTTSSGKSSSAAGTGKTTSELQTPTAYGTGSSIYANWNVNVDDTTGNDDPWDFGTSSQYPILKYGALQNVTQR